MRAEHRRHDRLLVTRYAMDDAYSSERDDARQLIESCPDCAALVADIRQLASATSQLPSAKRTRDFTITADQADKLRGSRLSRWMRGLTAPGWGALRPVAGAALSIGIVMVAVGVALPHPAAPTLESSTGSGQPVFAAGPTANPAPQVPGAGGAERSAAAPPPQAAATVGAEFYPMASDTDKVNQPGDAQVDGLASEDPNSQELSNVYVAPTQMAGTDVGGEAATPVRNANTTSNLLIYGGLAIAAISAALLGLAWFARRRFTDPLLR